MVYKRYRIINPLLGIYFSIFTSIYIGLLITLIILGEINWFRELHILILTGSTLFLTSLIALATFTSSIEDYFSAGRRIPAGFNGLVLFANGLGGTGLLGLIGLFFFMGLDALSIGFGFMIAFFIMGISFSPFIRKCGAYTLPSYLGLRFSNRTIQICLFLTLVPAAFAFALAEVSLIHKLGEAFFGPYKTTAAAIIIGTAIFCAIMGGMRSTTWTGCAWSIVLLMGLLFPLIIMAIKITYLPIPQLTFGSLIKEISQFEALRGLKLTTGDLTGITGGLTQSLQKPPGTLFTSLSFGQFLVISLIFAIGLSVRPCLLMRLGTGPTVYEARKACSWAVAIMALFIISAVAYVIFVHYIIFDTKLSWSTHFTGWLKELETFGFLQFDDQDGNQKMMVSELKLNRDIIFFLLTLLPSFPESITALTFSAVIAAVIVSLSNSLSTISNMVGLDLIGRRNFHQFQLPGHFNLILSRLALILTGGLALWIGLSIPFDPFALFTLSTLYLAVVIFPIFSLMVWWEKLTPIGVLAGLVAGAILFVFYGLFHVDIFANKNLIFGNWYIYAGFILLNFISAIAASLLLPSTREAETNNLIQDLQLPGGEAVFDRMIRIHMPRSSTN